jgi:gliding motility associated protien GldN
METQELKDDSIVTVSHRSDDVVWARIVYRVIDMRYKQNHQLYYPVKPKSQEKALFRVMLEAVADGMPVYRTVDEDNIVPDFRNGLYERDKIPNLVDGDIEKKDESGNTYYFDNEKNISTSDYMLLHYDSINGVMTFNPYYYEQFARNQLKYIIQEVVFFDKHYSRLYSRILAIAPLWADAAEPPTEETKIIKSLYQQLLFWVPFDSFRPYLAQQYVAVSPGAKDNDIKRVTFDEFFAKKLYSSYILGVSNMRDNRMIPEYATTREEIKAEQDRIEREILDFELDLWEY